MSLKSFLLVLCSSLSTQLYAQVNMVTGSAEQSFPLVNYVDSKSGLSLNVSLNYSSGNGLVVSELASDVGTGWHLSAGGAISRVVVGEPDDQRQYPATRQAELAMSDLASLKKYPSGFLYSGPQNGKCSDGFDVYPLFSNDNVPYKKRNDFARDMEQDRFVFNFNGHSGSFVIDKNKVVRTLGDSRMKISFTEQDMLAQGIRTTISSFIIVTEDGLKYVFNEKSLTYVTRVLPVNAWDADVTKWNVGFPGSTDEYQVSHYSTMPIDPSSRPFVVTGWHLSEIINQNNGERITFSYEDLELDVAHSKFVSHPRDLYPSKKTNYTRDEKNAAALLFNRLTRNEELARLYSWDIGQLNQLPPKNIIVTHLRNKYTVKRPKQIVLPDGSDILFTYSPEGRVDLAGANALVGITYRYDGKDIRSYKLGYKYFFRKELRDFDYPFDYKERKYTRLCLTSIEKIGTDEDNEREPPYEFSYYTGGVGEDNFVPPYNSLAIDHGGYYNGNVSQLRVDIDANHDCFTDATASEQYFKAVLPANHNPKSGYAQNGLLKAVLFPTGGSLSYVYQQNTSATDPAVPGLLMGWGVSVASTKVTDGEDASKDIVTTYSYVRPDGSSSHVGEEAPAYHNTTKVRYRLEVGTLDYSKMGIEAVEMASPSPKQANVTKSFLVGVGVNILTTVFSAVIGGSQFGGPWAAIASGIVGLVIAIVEANKPYDFYSFTLSNGNAIQNNPLQIFNERVVVRTNEAAGANGMTEHVFTSYSDYPAWVPSLSWPYLQRQRFASWAYGLPKYSAVYRENGEKVVEQSNSYSFIADPLVESAMLNCHCENNALHSLDNISYTSSNYGVDLRAPGSSYYLFSGRTDLASTSVMNFVVGGARADATVTNFVTDPQALIQKGSLIDNKPQGILMVRNTFPLDYSISTGAIGLLKQNNAIHTPIATERLLTKYERLTPQSPYQNATYLLDSRVTEYKIFTNLASGRQEVKPFRIHKLKTPEPINVNAWGNDRSRLLQNSNYYKVESEFLYDNNVNLVGVKGDGRITTYLNDYKDRLVVATTINAAPDQVAYCSFEADGAGKWTFNRNRIIRLSGSVTGRKALDLQSGDNVVFSGTLNPAIGYYVTVWAKGSVFVNGGSGELLYTSAQGWKLYRFVLSNSTTATVTGSGAIDELRLHPKDALMATTAYRVGFGKTEECDANNRIIRYEYDSFGRIRLVRDQEGSILKTYEYNYKRNQ